MYYITSHVTLQALCNNKEVRDMTGCHNIYPLFHSLFHRFLHSYTNLRLNSCTGMLPSGYLMQCYTLGSQTFLHLPPCALC